MITQSELKNILHYDQDTGVFTWAIQKSLTIKVGDVAGSLSGNGYNQIFINRKSYKAHRLAWLYVYGEFPNKFIDHINGIRNDNRIINLRNVTKSENSQNQKTARTNNKSGFLGVSWEKKSHKWRASIRYNNKTTYIGLYETKELAHEAYLTKKREVHSCCTI